MKNKVKASLMQKSLFGVFVLFLIDFYNLPTLLMTDRLEVVIVTVIIAVVLLLCQGIKIGFKNLKNMVDWYFAIDLFAIAIIISALMIIIEWLIYEAQIIKFLAYICIAVISALFICFIKKYCLNEPEKPKELYDLKQLANEEIPLHNKQPILFSEKDVHYDLLERGSIINQAVNSIIRGCSEKSFVISLEGNWGSGKTTILNNIRPLLRLKDDKIIIIDSFDPWLYGSEPAMLTGLYEEILKNSGIEYSATYNAKIINSLIDITISDSNKSTFIKNIIKNEKNDVEKLKQRISSFLIKSDKKIAFFIDNLDRADADNVVYLFKLISMVFDLPNIVYVLSFERDRIESILKDTKKIDDRFTEKIINQQIKVPEISSNVLSNLCFTSIINLLILYGVDENDLPNYYKITELIIQKTQNIRQLKRLFNSAFSITFCDKNILYKPDLLAIQVILFYDDKLYSIIKNQKKYFISHQISIESKVKYSFLADNDNRIKEYKDFYSKLTEEFSEYTGILKELFPYIRRCEGFKTDIFKNHDTNENQMIYNNARICSDQYFDSYFSFTQNEHIEIKVDLENIIDQVNSANNQEEIDGIVYKIIQSYNKELHKQVFEEFENLCIELDESKYVFVAKSLYNHIYEVDNRSAFMSLNAKSRAIYIIAKLLSLCSETNCQEFMTEIQYDYYKIEVIDNTIYWLNSINKKGDLDLSTKVDIIQNIKDNMCREIFDNKINIYDDEYYYRHNMYVLYRFCENNSAYNIKDYISSVLSERNVYRVLGDTIGFSQGKDYRYYINKNTFIELINTSEDIDVLIQNNQPKTEDERFVLSVYEKFIRYKDNYDKHSEEHSVVSSYEMELTL